MPTTVILGAGIIGLSSAHALAALVPPDHSIHLIEPSPTLFASASGHAAGFLAKDWFAPAIAALGVLSFDLHRALADKHNGRARWGYAESISYSMDHASDCSEDVDSESLDVSSADPAPPGTGAPTDAPGNQSEGGLDWLLNGVSRATAAESGSDSACLPSSSTNDAHDVPRWLRAKPDALQAISDRRSTAQVHPKKLCEFLLEQCLAAGVTLHQPAHATALVRDEEEQDTARTNDPTRLRVEYSDGAEGQPGKVVYIPCENIVIAAGCWTPQVYVTLFPNASRIPCVSHLAGYSLTFKSKHWSPPPLPQTEGFEDGTRGSTGSGIESTDPTCHAIFTAAEGFAPEIFSRATGDVWLGGLNPTGLSLPALPTEASGLIDATQIARLRAVARALCGPEAGEQGKGGEREEGEIQMNGYALCFRPVSATGRPIIARVHEADLGDGPKPSGACSRGSGNASGGRRDAKGEGRNQRGGGGVFVATGHGPWGIALSLGTGRVVAEMVLGRETSADVSVLARW